jgi:hypothetical protein
MVNLEWFKQGFGEDFEDYNPLFYFTLDFSDAVISTDENIVDIAVNTVNSIAKQHPPPYNLMVSGGVDSQAMIYAWYKSGVPFKIISFKYTDGNGKIFNEHDLENLDIFTKRFNLNVDYREINIIDFLENDLVSLATDIKCTSPQICAHAKIASMVNEGTVIFSGNALYKSATMYNYTVFGIQRYAQIQKNIIPFFFLYDKFIAGAFLDMSKNKNMEKYNNKCDLYLRGGFPIIPQPDKYNGFEIIKEYYDSQRDRITPDDRLRFINKPSKRVFDVLFRYRLIKSIKYKDSAFVKYPPY